MQLHRVGRVVQSSASALSNCDARFQATLAGKLSRSVRSLLRPGGLFGLVACLVAAGLLWFWQVELTIEATGTLVPRNRAFVFAPDDGVVEAIHVEDGVAVSAGALLVEFSNDDLLLRRETVEGELAAARARLAAIDSMRGDRSANQNNLLSAEQAELNEQVRSLEKQATLLEARQRQLQITARIGGVVRGERLRETLLRRPVHRGQLLFQIADPQGEWELDLRIDEGDVRHVVSAVHGQSKPLRVTFSLETSPETRRETQLAELSNAADVDEFGRVTTRATAAFPHAVSQSPGQSDEMRPGAGVVAAIQCGRQSAGFVWFRKVIEFVQRQRMW